MAKNRDGVLRGLEITANLGIVLGLVLVSVQIAQEREIADTTFTNETYGSVDDYYELVAGEDAAASLARAIFEPTALTARDGVVLDALYSAEFTKLMRIEATLAPEAAVASSTVARWQWDLLTHPWAHAWWEANADMFRFAPRHRNAIDAALAARPEATTSQRAMFEAIDRILASTAEAE